MTYCKYAPPAPGLGPGIPAISAFTRIFDALCAGMNGESDANACRETSMPPWLEPSLLPAYAAALAFGYLCGSIPFGLILTRLAGTADIRAIGSGHLAAPPPPRA